MTEPNPDPNTRIDPRLRARLEAAPADLQSVSVWFTELPTDAELGRAGLAATGTNPALGMVDAAGTYALAGRADVVRIVLQPESRLL